MPPRPVPSDIKPTAQTIVRFPRAMLGRARIRAATDEVTLQSLLIKALDAELNRHDKVEARGLARRSDRHASASRYSRTHIRTSEIAIL